MVNGDHSPRRRRPAPSTLTVDRGSTDTIYNASSSSSTNHKHTTVLAGGGGDGSSTISNSKERIKKRKRQRGESSPFWILVLQVGTTLAITGFVSYKAYRFVFPAPIIPGDDTDDDTFTTDDAAVGGNVPLPLSVDPTDGSRRVGDAGLMHVVLHDEDEVQNTTHPPLPVWELTNLSRWDAFAWAEHYDKPTDPFWMVSAGLRKRFVELYGGENAGRAILERALSTTGEPLHGHNYTLAMGSDPPDDLHHTACRIQTAMNQNRPFRMAFGGYSVTAGRGNYHHQSFPLQMEKLLHTLFHTLGIELQVRNAAIGGCPSFPYGWCLREFWGDAPDVVSWDYSMNEAGEDPAIAMEAYARYVWQLPLRPKLIVKDTHMALERRELLRRYHPWLRDTVIIHTDPAVQPFLDRPEEARPTGFQAWRKFGAPPGAPGQVVHHPAVAEHTFIAYLLALHMTSALQWVAAHRDGSVSLLCPEDSFPVVALPPPLLLRMENGDNNDEKEEGPVKARYDGELVIIANSSIVATKPWYSILFGEPSVENPKEWFLNPVFCRTTYQPILSGQLLGILVHGHTGDELDVMLPKSKMFYNRAWVYDLSDEEKQAKRNLDRFGGLGFLDGKPAYYGLPASGPLVSLLPYQSDHRHKVPATTGGNASHFFKSILWCEVNERRDSSACVTVRDIHFVVGGINVTEPVAIDTTGTVFGGKSICTYLRVPALATLTTRRQILANFKEKSTDVRFVLPDEPNVNDESLDEVGLALEAVVTNLHLIKREQACSVSHIIWEQVRMDSSVSSD